MRDTGLKKASRLYKARKFTLVLQLLEPQVFRFRQNFKFYYLLGMSCLNTSDFGGGYSYLQRALDLKPMDVNTLAGMAVIYLKRGDNSEALQHWFQILDNEPDNRLAKRGLDILKKYSNPEELIEYIESGRILSLLPDSGKIFPFIKTVLITLSILFLFVFSSYYAYLYFIKDDIKRPEIASIELNRFGSLIDDSISSTYNYTDKEIRKLFETIRHYFDTYQDNLAMREINRLLLSNADEDTRTKALLLAKYITVPGFTTLKNNFSYQEYIKEPELYLNCYVHWKGKVSNLLVTENEIRFDFLVGYEDEKVLEGIIPVSLDFGARIDTTLPIEILGKLTNTGSEIVLTAVSIHQYQLEQ